MTETELLAVSFGGGVNSTAMLVEMFRRGIAPDIITFADTGGERPETYAAVNQVSSWCEARFEIGVTIVRKVRASGEILTLEQNCLEGGMLPSLAYGFKSCSLKYKVQPQDKLMNHWPPALDAWKRGAKVRKAIGYDASEERRAKIREDDKYRFWYPLIEWGIHREDCVSICKSEGLPTAKSSCFFCPAMKKREIVELLKQHPQLFERAVAMERNAELTSVKGLGRSFSWADFIAGERNHRDLFDGHATPETPCECYDG